MDIFSSMKNNEINITKLTVKHPEKIKMQQDKKRSMSIHSIAKTLTPKKHKPWTMRPNGFVGSV